MSCVREVQWACEEWTGVDPGVTKVVQALHANVTGRYETEYGATSLNMYWETWDNSMFRDRSHLGHNGREYFCERVSPVIDEILSER